MRTEFGQRLFTARKSAKLTQLKLSKAVGMSQGTYGELELTGQGSSYTPAIARELGVSVEWLAYGHGEMEMDVKNPPKQSANDGDELTTLGRSLAELFDTLPKDDPDLRAKAFSRCADAILLLKAPQLVAPTTEAPRSNQETPPAKPPRPTSRSK